MVVKGKRLSEVSPFFYELALEKEIVKRSIKNKLYDKAIAKEIAAAPLPNLVYAEHSDLIKRAKGVDPQTQYNKLVNIQIASSKINKLVIHPGETFSFWTTVGHATKRKGYKEGRIIQGTKMIKGTGGGLCNLSNSINKLVLHSPLEITEFHKHSDALAPDEHGRVPLSAGTSVCYNSVDYRFKNTTDQDFQLLLWVENEQLFGEIRSERPIEYRYEIFEKDHHFAKEGDKYYRISKIYRNTIDKKTNEVVDTQLIWDNHSEVMFDYDLIPKESIRE
ncbi:MAG: VanW family protein [Clostridia bacterium]|nr:VanW family protein [Clostridia bacterium]